MAPSFTFRETRAFYADAWHRGIDDPNATMRHNKFYIMPLNMALFWKKQADSSTNHVKLDLFLEQSFSITNWSGVGFFFVLIVFGWTNINVAINCLFIWNPSTIVLIKSLILIIDLKIVVHFWIKFYWILNMYRIINKHFFFFFWFFNSVQFKG